MSSRTSKKYKIAAANDFPKYTIIWGGGDQARVLKPIIDSVGGHISALIDDTSNHISPFPDIDIFHGHQGLIRWLKGRKPNEVGFIIAIGNPYGKRRCQLHDQLKELGLRPVTLIDPSASIDPSAKIGAGSQIMTGAIVNVDAKLARQCIINTRAVIEHDDLLGEGVEVAPNATLCGRVEVGNYAWICAGSTIIPRIKIGEAALIAAGSVVVNHVQAFTTVAGNPAQPITSKVRNVL